MRRVFLALILLSVILCTETVADSTVLVVGDSLIRDETRAVVNLLGHFPEFSVEGAVTDVVDSSEVLRAEVVFFLAREDSPFPPPSIQRALFDRKGTTVFMGAHRWLGALGNERSISVLRYKGTDLPTGGFAFHDRAVPFGIAVVRGGGDEREAALVERSQNRWLIKGFPLFEMPGWVLGDLLHDILGVVHRPRKRLMVRLEDINPSYEGENLEKLRSCIDYLEAQKVPFAMAVYPVFINPRGKGTARVLSMNAELVTLLRRAERGGGTIIMHGTSHQYYQVSGEGSEFWDMRSDNPIPAEKEYFHSHMRYGLFLFREAGLRPLAFEAPHYNLPLSLQIELKAYFSTLCGNPMLNDRTSDITQSAPFFLETSGSGLRVMPEQLGYVRFGAEENTLQDIKERGRVLARVVRDPDACFFYHPYLEGDRVLKELIPWFRMLGYEFIDLSELGGPPKVTVTAAEPLWELAESRGIVFARSTLAFGVLAILFLAFIYTKARKRRKEENRI